MGFLCPFGILLCHHLMTFRLPVCCCGNEGCDEDDPETRRSDGCEEEAPPPDSRCRLVALAERLLLGGWGVEAPACRAYRSRFPSSVRMDLLRKWHNGGAESGILGS